MIIYLAGNAPPTGLGGETRIYKKVDRWHRLFSYHYLSEESESKKPFKFLIDEIKKGNTR